MIEATGNSNPDGKATGFMISDDLVMTNAHVLKEPAQAVGAFAKFNYEQDEAGQIKPFFEFPLNPEKFFHSNTALDYAVVAVADSPGKEWGSINVQDATTAAVGDSVIIIQHPFGLPTINQSISNCTYSPDRNPDELVWKHLRADTVGRMTITDKADFKAKVRASMCQPQNDPEKIRTKNYRSNMPPDSAFTYGLINMISRTDNEVKFVDDVVLQYLTDTSNGSSGSPIFDFQLRLVGIHQRGGQLHLPGDVDGVTYFRNQGIRMTAIVTDPGFPL